MRRTGRELLQIGVERGYLDARTAAHMLAEANDRGCSVHRLLQKVLSPRRIARLRNHHHYRTMRKVDKLYAALAVREGHLTKTQVLVSLDHQKQRFEGERQCVRLGSHLIVRGLLTFDEDRVLLARVTGSKLPSEIVRQAEEVPSSAATLALDEESMLPSPQPSSYAQIEEAVRRVDTLRSIQNDLSTSDNVGTGKRAQSDSANEIENALTMLARRRLGTNFANPPLPPEPKRKTRKTRKKATTGLMRIFRLGAA